MRSPPLAFVSGLERLGVGLGRLASGLLLAAAGLVFTVVVLRYLFSRGGIALQESGVWLNAAAFLLAAGWTLSRDEHVRVDVFYQTFGDRGRAAVNLAGTLLFLLPFCCWLLYAGWGYAGAAWAVHEASPEAGGLPGLYLLKSLIPLTAAALAVQGVAEICKALGILSRPQRRLD